MSRDPDGLRSAGASSSAPPPVFTSPTPLSPYNEKSDSRHPKSNGVTYSDRFIPSRQRGVPLHDSFALLPDSPGAAPKKRDSPQTVGSSDAASKDDNLDTYSMLLRSELLGPDQLPSPSYRSLGADQQPSPQQRNLFRFRASPTARDENAAFSLSPVGQDSQRVLASPRKAPRKISTVPYKVLDAPALQDDFYLNLVDWSSLNVLAVGLGTCVYLWSACTSKVTKLCDLGPDPDLSLHLHRSP